MRSFVYGRAEGRNESGSPGWDCTRSGKGLCGEAGYWRDPQLAERMGVWNSALAQDPPWITVQH